MKTDLKKVITLTLDLESQERTALETAETVIDEIRDLMSDQDCNEIIIDGERFNLDEIWVASNLLRELKDSYINSRIELA